MRWTVVAAIFFIALGCKRRDEVADAGQSVNAPVPIGLSRETLDRFHHLIPDAGLGLESFAGFSADETRFAWSAFSVGAGGHVLTIAPVARTDAHQKFLLDNDHSEAARAALADGGFSTKRRSLGADAGEVRVAIDGELVRLQYAIPGSPPEALYVGSPFDGPKDFARPDFATFWGLSPSGRIAVLETVTAAHPEFGSAKSFRFIPIQIEEKNR